MRGDMERLWCLLVLTAVAEVTEGASGPILILPAEGDTSCSSSRTGRMKLRATEATITVRGLLSEEDLGTIYDAERAAWENARLARLDMVNTTREFGKGKSEMYGNHTVTFLHYYLPAVTQRLKRGVFAAVRTAGWDLGFSEDELSIRCAESIRYSPGGDQGTGGIGLGWHADEASTLTMAVALSDPAEYSGGSFQVCRKDIETLNNVHRGDVVLWRAWDLHRVTPLRGGARHVFVIEWWNHGVNPQMSPAGRPSAPVQQIPSGGDAVLLQRCRRHWKADSGSPMLGSVCGYALLAAGQP
eukprot:Hpha_TRINITY_DN10032_c0_g2::TRINITY_DN10032_c0_g2_i1::g.84027::m.84027